MSASRHWPLPQPLECGPGPHYPSIYLQEPLRFCHRLCCTNEPPLGPEQLRTMNDATSTQGPTQQETIQCNAIPRFIATTKARESLPRTRRHVTRIARCSSRTNPLTRVIMFQKSSARSCDYALVGIVQAHFSTSLLRILYSPVVTICATSLTFSNTTFSPHSIFMCFVWI